MFKLQFYSRPDLIEGTNEAYGYDGSMTVETFDPADIQEYLDRMDCVFGPCIVIVAPTKGHQHRAYHVTRKYNY